MRQGEGSYTYADGSKYHGQWQNDEKNGQGKLVYPSQDVFEGQFVGGLRQGNG
jgi:hypothetical protein